MERNKERLEDWTNDYFSTCIKKEMSAYEPLLKSITLQFIDLILNGEGNFVGQFLMKAQSVLIRSTYPRGHGQKLEKVHPARTERLIPFTPQPLSKEEQAALIKKRGLPR